MNARQKPTRAQRKAQKAERHEIVRSIMQEPEDVVHFPVAFGKIAVNMAVTVAVILGVLALGVLSSAVFLMRDELGALSKQLQQKDGELGALSQELQKVRDQMFGEQEEMMEQGITVRLVNAETGVASTVSNVSLHDTPYPLAPESRAVNGKYLYWTDEEGILRVNLEDGTSVRLVATRFISSLAVSKDGSWLAYAYSEGLSDPESVGETRAVAMPLSGRGDPLELGVLSQSDVVVARIHGFSDDNKELLWIAEMGEDFTLFETLHRLRVANGQETGKVEIESGIADAEPGETMKGTQSAGFSPNGKHYVLLEVTDDGSEELRQDRVVIHQSSTKRAVAQYVFQSRQFPTAIVWAEGGGGVIFSDGDDAIRLSVDDRAATLTQGKCTVIPSLFGKPCASLDNRWFLQMMPVMLRNLVTGNVSVDDAAGLSIAGWSETLNAVVFIVQPQS